MRILVVEDDVCLGRQIASALTEAGHYPIVVHDGEGALDETKQTRFDLIMLDITVCKSNNYLQVAGLAAVLGLEPVTRK